MPSMFFRKLYINITDWYKFKKNIVRWNYLMNMLCIQEYAALNGADLSHLKSEHAYNTTYFKQQYFLQANKHYTLLILTIIII